VIAATTVANLILFATGCAGDTPVLLEQSEPTEASEIVDTVDPRRPIQARGMGLGGRKRPSPSSSTGTPSTLRSPTAWSSAFVFRRSTHPRWTITDMNRRRRCWRS
jgi:hypothetical protein